MDKIVFLNKGYNNSYGWVYEVKSCTKEIPDDFSFLKNFLLSWQETRKLIDVLMPIKYEYEKDE